MDDGCGEGGRGYLKKKMRKGCLRKKMGGGVV